MKLHCECGRKLDQPTSTKNPSAECASCKAIRIRMGRSQLVRVPEQVPVIEPYHLATAYSNFQPVARY